MGHNHKAIEILKLDEQLLRSRMDFLIAYADTEIEKAGRNKQDEWEFAGAVGTALVDAAQAAWFVDQNSFAGLLRRAAKFYISLGLPYGLFLLSLIAHDDELEDELQKTFGAFFLELISGAKLPNIIPGDMGPLAQQAIHYPNQRIYLLAAFLGHSQTAREKSGLIIKALKELEPFRSQPMGPQSAPLDDYLKIVKFSLVLQERQSYVANYLSEEKIISEIEPVIALGQRFAVKVEYGMENHYLWKQLLSPVELIDLEAAGLLLRIEESVGFKQLPIVEQTMENRLHGSAAIPLYVSRTLVEYRRHFNP